MDFHKSNLKEPWITLGVHFVISYSFSAPLNCLFPRRSSFESEEENSYLPGGCHEPVQTSNWECRINNLLEAYEFSTSIIGGQSLLPSIVLSFV